MTEWVGGARYPDLGGKVAVVTGGSKGIGLATSHALAANGARVAVVARDEKQIEQAVTAIGEEGGVAAGFPCDCCVADAVDAMVGGVVDSLGPPDVLMAFAGGFTSTTPILEITEEEWRSVIDANLTSTFLTVRSVLPVMIERRAGAIVTMASNAARLLDIPLTASYAAAKAGIVMFTRHLAIEVGRHGVRANVVAPATTSTERVERTLSHAALRRVEELAPLGRIGRPEDSASAALFLASDVSAWLTGITIDVAGGRVML